MYKKKEFKSFHVRERVNGLLKEKANYYRSISNLIELSDKLEFVIEINGDEGIQFRRVDGWIIHVDLKYSFRSSPKGKGWMECYSIRKWAEVNRNDPNFEKALEVINFDKGSSTSSTDQPGVYDSISHGSIGFYYSFGNPKISSNENSRSEHIEELIIKVKEYFKEELRDQNISQLISDEG